MTPMDKVRTMKRMMQAIALAGLVAGFAPAAQAFECPGHFAKAEQAIEKATAAMERMQGDHALVHTLIDDAKMYLESARHNHEKPAAGGYDHARAIAKARAAIGYAESAQILAER